VSALKIRGKTVVVVMQGPATDFAQYLPIAKRLVASLRFPPSWRGRRAHDPLASSGIGRASRAEVGEHCEHAAVVIGRLIEVELGEDLPDMCFDGSLGHDESFGDRGVRPIFGHESENLPFALGQLVEGPGRVGRQALEEDRLTADCRRRVRWRRPVRPPSARRVAVERSATRAQWRGSCALSAMRVESRFCRIGDRITHVRASTAETWLAHACWIQSAGARLARTYQPAAFFERFPAVRAGACRRRIVRTLPTAQMAAPGIDLDHVSRGKSV